MSRMRRMKTKLRRGFAMFLSLCIMFSMFQGVAWADVGDDDGGEIRNALIELDGQQLLAEAENAIRTGELFDLEDSGMSFMLRNEDGTMVISEDYRKVLSSDTGNVYAVYDIPYIDEVSAGEALGEATLSVFVKLGDGEILTATGSDAQRDINKGTPSNAQRNGFDVTTEDYTMTGKEQFIFLFINPGNDEINFQLDISGRRTGIISVGRESALLSGEEVIPEQVPVQPTQPEGPTVPAVSGGSASGGGSGASGTPAETAAPEESGSTAVEEPESSEEESEIVGEESESGEEASEGESEEEKDQEGESDTDESQEEVSDTDTADSQETDGEETKEQTGEDVSEDDSVSEAEGDEDSDENLPEENQDQGEADSKGDDSDISDDQSPEEEAPEQAEAEDSGDADVQSDEGDDAADEGGQDSDELALSFHKVYRVGEPIEGDFSDVDFYEWQKQMGEDEEEEQDYSDDVTIINENTEGVELETYVLPTVVVGTGSGSAMFASTGASPRRMAARSSRSVDATAGIMMVSSGSLGTTEEARLNLMKVNLYNYNAGLINTSIGYTGNRNDLFLINVPGDARAGAQNRITSPSDSAFQGIMSETYEGGRLKLASQYSAGGIDYVYRLFPENKEEAEASKAIGVVNSCFDVTIGDGVFQYKDGYYVLNALENPQDNGKDFVGMKGVRTRQSLKGSESDGYSLELDSRIEYNGFWPFDAMVRWDESYRGPGLTYTTDDSGRKEAFGMKMSFDFNMPASGKGLENKDAEFSFAGDDDVWIYIREQGSEKGLLALDLGGIHGATSGHINFATGEIVHDKVYSGTGTAKQVRWYLYNDCPNPGDYDRVVGLARPKLGESKSYTLDFYYMERGGARSSCYIDFNMRIIPQKEIKIQKQVVGTTDVERFNFNVVGCDDRETLEAFKKLSQQEISNLGSNGERIQFEGEEILRKSVSLVKARQSSVDIDTRYFYVEETTPGELVEWNSLGDDRERYKGDIVDEGDGKRVVKSETYDRTELNNGYLIQCTNYYGEVLPDVNKSAWLRSETNQGRSMYDIALEVNGSSAESGGGLDGANIMFLVDPTANMNKENLKNALVNTLNGLQDPDTEIALYINWDYMGWYNMYADYWMVSGTGVDGLRKIGDIKNWVQNIEKASFSEKAGTLSAGIEAAYGSVFKGKKGHLIVILGGEPDTTDLEAYMARASEFGITIHIIEVHNEGDNSTWISGSTKTTPEQLESTLGNIVLPKAAGENQVTDPYVYDTLSQYVQLSNQGGWKMWISEQEVGLTSGQGNGNLVSEASQLDKTNQITGTLDSKTGIITFRKSGEEVAWYYQNETTEGELVIPAKTIKWKVAERLGAGEHRTLIYPVEVTGDYLESGEYPHNPGAGTGTHAIRNEMGYYSNAEAYLIYNTDRAKEFLHPVVRPSDPTSPTATITVVKEIADFNTVPDEAKETEFKIQLNSNGGVYTDNNKTKWGGSENSLKHRDGKIETGTLYLDKQNEFVVTEDNNLLFELQDVTVTDDTGAVITPTKEGENSYKFSISTDTAQKHHNITVTVKNQYKAQSPIKVQKFVDNASEDSTPFSITVTECSVEGTGTNRTVAKVKDGESAEIKISSADKEQTTGLTVPVTAKTYVVEENNTDNRYVLDKIEVADQAAAGTSKNVSIEVINGQYVVTVKPGSQPIIQVYNKKMGRVRVQKEVEGTGAPKQDFMIQVKSAGGEKGDGSTYVDAGMVLGNLETSGWIMIDQQTTIEITETQIKEFRLDSMELNGQPITPINGKYQVEIKPGEDYTITVINKYEQSSYFHSDDGTLNDFNKSAQTAKAQCNEVEFAVERRFLITEQSIVLEPRELPEQLL